MSFLALWGLATLGLTIIAFLVFMAAVAIAAWSEGESSIAVGCGCLPFLAIVGAVIALIAYLN